MKMLEQILVIPEDAKTPNYDKISHDVKKLLTATAATYIPELCESLRKDWFPRATDETFKRDENKPVRDEIRERILDDWSNQRNWSESPWGDRAITLWFPNWLKNKTQMESNKTTSALGGAARKYQAILASQQAKIFSEKTINQLPEVPKQLTSYEEEEEVVTGGWSLGPSKYHKLGEDTKSPLTKMGDIRDACRELCTALSDKEHMPHDNEDLIVEHIKPTREYRKFIYELDEREQTGLYNWLVYTEAYIKDMLDILDEARK